MASPSSEDDIGSKMASNEEGNSDERQQGGQKRGHITMERMEGQSGQAKREETVAKLQYNEKLKRERKKNDITIGIRSYNRSEFRLKKR